MIQANTIKTKSFWSGIALIATGVGLIIAGDVPHGVEAIVGGIVTIFLRDAIAKVGVQPNGKG